MRYRIKQYDSRGELLKAKELPSAEAIAEEVPPDYRLAVEEACLRADQRLGNWAQIILGPPELASAVDRLEIQAIL